MLFETVAGPVDANEPWRNRCGLPGPASGGRVGHRRADRGHTWGLYRREQTLGTAAPSLMSMTWHWSLSC